MKRIAFTLVFVVAVLAVQQCTLAQGGVSSMRSVSPRTITPQMQLQSQSPQSIYTPQSGFESSQLAAASSLAKFTAKRTGDSKMPDGAFNGFAQLRLIPDLGAPGSAGNGFHHFSMPMEKYTNWYRPRAATLTQYQRCAPDSFRPRGFGNLFARPCDGYRMEYEPYVLSDGMSMYGPAYIARMPDPRCDDCDCQHCNGNDCEDCD